MRKTLGAIIAVILIGAALTLALSQKTDSYCFTGAFIADRPSGADIRGFYSLYGKKPYIVSVFIDWNNFIDKSVITGVYSSGCMLMIAWEPWLAGPKEGIDFDALLSGGYDAYIGEFALRLKEISGPVMLRFGHEMNGNWYPWSGVKIGEEKYISSYRYIKDMFDKAGVKNVEWVFCVNSEDVPRKNNHFMQYYPGDEYVDYVGLDGYNWGNTQTWSAWKGFREIFGPRIREIAASTGKPVIIAEFSSAGSGGDKAAWIRNAMDFIKNTGEIKGFAIFNVDKEADWSFPAGKAGGGEFRKKISEGYFKDER